MAKQTKPTTTGWVGWIVFAAFLLMLNGTLQFISGLVGMITPEYFVVTDSGLLLLDHTGWGWVNALMGLLVIATGLALMTGRMWARIVAVFLVSAAAITHLSFLNAYPLWGITLLLVDGLILYAVIRHGDEVV